MDNSPSHIDAKGSGLLTLDVNELMDRSAPDRPNNLTFTKRHRIDSAADNIAVTPAMATSTPLDTTMDIEIKESERSSRKENSIDETPLDISQRLPSDPDLLRERLQKLIAGLQDDSIHFDPELMSNDDTINNTIDLDDDDNFDIDDDDDDDDDDDIIDIMDLDHIEGDFLGTGQLPQPLYPMGPLTYKECIVCLEMKDVNLRTCCEEPVCDDCVLTYVTIQIQQANVKIGCPNDGCDKYVHRDEVMTRISGELKEKYHKFLVDANKEANVKTCPRCSAITKVDPGVLKTPKVKKKGLRKCCVVCELDWCFLCQAPWHEGITCKNFRKGDKLLKSWAKSQQCGQVNAQRCPKCKIYIQRSSGCDHMTCTKCQVDFCYRCGERHIRIKFLGDHYTRLSVFGCKYRFLPNNPVRRKLARGSILAAKISLLPVLTAVAIGVGAVVLTVGIFVLPVWGGVQIRKRVLAKRRRKLKKLENERWKKYIQEIRSAGDPYMENFIRMKDLGHNLSYRKSSNIMGKHGILMVDEVDMKRVAAEGKFDSLRFESTANSYISDESDDYLSVVNLPNIASYNTIQLSADNLDIHAELNDEIAVMNKQDQLGLASERRKRCNSISDDDSVFSYGEIKETSDSVNFGDDFKVDLTMLDQYLAECDKKDREVVIDNICDSDSENSDIVIDVDNTKITVNDDHDRNTNCTDMSHGVPQNVHLDKNQFIVNSCTDMPKNQNRNSKSDDNIIANGIISKQKTVDGIVTISKSNSLPLPAIKNHETSTTVVPCSKQKKDIFSTKEVMSKSKREESKVKKLVSQYSCGLKSESDEKEEESTIVQNYNTKAESQNELVNSKETMDYKQQRSMSLKAISDIPSGKMISDTSLQKLSSDGSVKIVKSKKECVVANIRDNVTSGSVAQNEKVSGVTSSKVMKDVSDMNHVELRDHLSSFCSSGGVRKLVSQYSDNNTGHVFYV